MDKNYDFSGWATRNNIECSDGRTILKDAFKINDGQKVPLVWNHQHDDPNEVLGHAILENRPEGVYTYCKFNDTESGQTAKSLVQNGDVDKLSIYANKLKTNMGKVVHGCIREVSLVLAGANPGAFIDSVVVHGEGADIEEEVVIFTDETISLEHSELNHSDENNVDDSKEADTKKEEKEDSEKVGKEEEKEKDKTIEEVFNTLNEEQKNAVYAIIGAAIEDQEGQKNEEGVEENMKHNVFDNENNEEVLVHSEIVNEAVIDARNFRSMKESFLAHAAANNIDNMDVLFPDAKEINDEPGVIKNNDSWVTKVMNGVKHTPFSRVKATYGKLTEDQARARGYIKGNKKASIQLSFLNRVTTPTTVYIKNDIDRDDQLDIADFDVVKWIKREMRAQLDKELALAMLIGDGREDGSQDKISEENIRPILKDNELYTVKYEVTEGRDYKNPNNSASDNDNIYKGVVRAAIKSRKAYKGSGQPTFYTSEDALAEMLLIEDQNGRLIYESEDKLARALRVKEIVTIPEFEREACLFGLIVNLADYTAGADKGGSVNMFDDFDIDFNQMKYLIETRMSGALTKPYSAIALTKKVGMMSVEG